MKTNTYIKKFSKVMRLIRVISIFGILPTYVVYSEVALNPKTGSDDAVNSYDPDCECPHIEMLNQSLEMYYDSPAIINDLVKGSYKNKVVFTLTIKGNKSELARYPIAPSARINCGNEIEYDQRLPCQNPYSNFTNTTTYNCEDSFPVPENAKSCRVIVKVFEKDDNRERETQSSSRNSSCGCRITNLSETYYSPYIEPLTFEEYINKYQVEISRRQTEMMGVQSNISQQQTEIMKENQRLEKERQIFGFDKGAILTAISTFLSGIAGIFIGFGLSDFRSYQEKANKDIKLIYVPLRKELEKIRKLVAEFREIDEYFNAAKVRKENLYCPIPRTQWDVILNNSLDFSIPDRLKKDLSEFYDGIPLFENYRNVRIDKEKEEERKEIQESTLKRLDNLIRQLKNECRTPNAFDYIGIRKSGK